VTREVADARGDVPVVEYPHVTTDSATGGGQPCIAETGIRVTDLVKAYEDGTSPTQLQEHFADREVAGGATVRHLSLSEVHAALAYYYDNAAAHEVMRAENDRLADAATRERHAAILKHYLGS